MRFISPSGVHLDPARRPCSAGRHHLSLTWCPKRGRHAVGWPFPGSSFGRSHSQHRIGDVLTLLPAARRNAEVNGDLIRAARESDNETLLCRTLESAKGLHDRKISERARRVCSRRPGKGREQNAGVPCPESQRQGARAGNQRRKSLGGECNHVLPRPRISPTRRAVRRTPGGSRAHARPRSSLGSGCGVRPRSPRPRGRGPPPRTAGKRPARAGSRQPRAGGDGSSSVSDG
jgi:hypothetical protein